MNEMRPYRWLSIAFLFGVAYFLVARFSTLPTNQNAARPMAWITCAGLCAGHFYYEQLRLKNSSPSVAFHVAVAVAVGALGLAAAGMVHSLSAALPIRPGWLLALILWPAFTSVPTFAGAFAASVLLRRLSPNQRYE